MPQGSHTLTTLPYGSPTRFAAVKEEATYCQVSLWRLRINMSRHHLSPILMRDEELSNGGD